MKAWQYLWFHFFIFLAFIKISYGSDNLREACISDKRGGNVKEDRLFLNFYDYWTMINAVITFDWFYPKIYILEKQIRRKLRKFQDFSTANVLLQKIKEKDSDFCPVRYLSEEENLFWKNKKMEERFWKWLFRKVPTFKEGMLAC